MPEYLAPGVYVEETTFRQKSIEGVSTSTAGFIGAVRFGPLEGEPEILTSFLDFERIYGGIDQLEFADGGGTFTHNDLAHGVRGFFENGGQRLYVARAFEHTAPPDISELHPDTGRFVVADTPSTTPFTLRARYPGEAGNFVVEIAVRAGQNVRTGAQGSTVLQGVLPHDTVLVVTPTPLSAELRVAHRFTTAAGVDTLQLRDAGGGNLVALTDLAADIEVYVVTLAASVSGMGRFVDERTWEELGPDPAHRDSLARVFAEDPLTRATELYVPLVVADGPGTGIEFLESILAERAAPAFPASAADELYGDLVATVPPVPVTLRRQLQLGTDGNRPPASAYEGDVDPTANVKSGLRAFEDLEDISIVAAPGSSRDALNGSATRRLVRSSSC